MKTYSEKLKDPRWQKKRLKIMERDKFRCRDTGSDTETLQVHHCHYAKGDPWDTPDELLLTLSETAHKKRQKLEDKAKEALGKLMSKLSNSKDNPALENFVNDLVRCSSRGIVYDVNVSSNEDEKEFIRLMDDRWLMAAYFVTDSRKCFEMVTGRKPHWEDRKAYA